MPHELIIVPGKSIGPFHLGMTRAEVWAQHSSPISAFFKTPAAKERTDDIRNLGVHIHYDGAGRCEFIEAWTVVPHFNITLVLGTAALNGKKMGEVRDILSRSSRSFIENDSGFEDKTEGVGFYCHTFESDDSLLDGVWISKKEASQAAQTTPGSSAPLR